MAGTYSGGLLAFGFVAADLEVANGYDWLAVELLSIWRLRYLQPSIVNPKHGSPVVRLVVDSPRMAFLMAAIGFFVASLRGPAEAVAAEDAPEVVLELPPGERNPRNSEGDFIRLNDGRLLLIYTRFTGGGGDHDAADLVSRQSMDGGKTWSQTDQTVIANESGWNVMSVSLLRLLDGRIALFYARKNSLTDCRPVVRFSADEGQNWSDAVPVIADDDVGYFVLNNDRVVQLTGGRS